MNTTTNSATACNTTNGDVERHLALVQRVVSRFMRKLPASVDRGDLISAGMYGLVTSLERNKGEEEGRAFETYATMRIRGAIIDELRTQDWLSRKARDAVSAGREGYVGPTSLVGFDDLGDVERVERMADRETPNALSLLEERVTREELTAAIASLPERERLIISQHYFEGVKLREIGQQLGVSEPRVSQLHTRAIGRLRDALGQQVAA